LAKKSERATYDTGIAQEKGLLLDPCQDHPEDYLTFVRGIVGLRDSDPARLAKLQQDTGMVPSERVTASIRTYGLNRPELIQDRQTLVLRLERHTFVIRQLTLLLHEYLPKLEDQGNAGVTRIQLVVENLLGHEIEDLLSLRDEHKVFAALARQTIAEFEEEFGSID
jgi:hypothetical protein